MAAHLIELYCYPFQYERRHKVFNTPNAANRRHTLKPITQMSADYVPMVQVLDSPQKN
jgi:hypothetical protein